MTDREKLDDLFADGKCPAWFIDNKQRLDTVDYLIANGVTVTDNNVGCKWRPASEPPKEDGSYLTFRKGIGKQVCRYANDLFKVNSVDFAYYDKGGIAGGYTNEGNGYYRLDDVTHWMPLQRLRRW